MSPRTMSFAKFFKLKAFAVVGASSDREKFGNKVLRCYQEYSKSVTAINKRSTDPIEGVETVESLTYLSRNLKESLLPKDIGISIITPPAVTQAIIEEGISCGFKHYFLQPGTTDENVESYIANIKATQKDIYVLQDCVLVQMGFTGYEGEEF